MRRRSETIPMNSRNLATPQDPRADSAADSNDKPRRRPVSSRVAREESAREKPVEASASVAEFPGRSNSASSGLERIEYHGHVLKVEPQRGGWKVTVFPEGSPFALHRIAYSSESSGRDRVIAEAKAMVDAERPKEPAPTPAPEQPEIVEAQSAEIEKVFAELGQLLLRWSSNAVSAAKRIYFSIDAR